MCPTLEPTDWEQQPRSRIGWRWLWPMLALTLLAGYCKVQADCQPNPALGSTIELVWTHDNVAVVDSWWIQYWSNVDDDWHNIQRATPACTAEDGAMAACSAAARRVDPGVDWPKAVYGDPFMEDPPLWISHRWYNLRVCAQNTAGRACSPSIGVCWPLWGEVKP